MLKFDRQGLIPAVIQDESNGQVLMVAFMNEEALSLTRATGYTHLFSRSRNKIWRKGEESGNVQEVRGLYVNCEENSLLLKVVQHGAGACHTGHRSCYYRRLLEDGSYETIEERVFDPAQVYTQAEPLEKMETEASSASTRREAAGKLPEPSRRDGSPELASGSPEWRDVSLPPSRTPGEEPQYRDVSLPPSRTPGEESLAEQVAEYAMQIEAASAEPVTQLSEQERQQLETDMRKLYSAYIFLRDHDLSVESNTSRLLQEQSIEYLVARLGDELQELTDVQEGTHVHSGRQDDTILEASQVGYWLMLLAATRNIKYDEVKPHEAILRGYAIPGHQTLEQAQECLNLLISELPAEIVAGLIMGFTTIGRACAEACVSPLAPAEYDMAQMRRKGLV